MNSCSLSARTRLVAGLLSLVVVTAGCRTHSERYGLRELGRTPQDIQEIEPLQLKKTEPNEATPEANGPPLATLDLSLEQSRALALENNLQLKATLINPAIAAAQLSAEEAKFESAFFVNANLLKTDQPFGRLVEIPGSGILVPTVTASQRERADVDLGVRMPLRTGGTVTFDIEDTQTNNLKASPFEINPIYENRTAISLSQPLLRNAGQRVTMYSIRVAAYSRDITSARTRLDVIAVLAALDRTYWRLYAARKELEVREQQHRLALAQLESARRLVEAGQRPPVEIIRAEAGVAQQLEQIIIAENSLRDRERELKRVVNRAGLNTQTPTVVIPTTLPDPVHYDLERQRLIDQAMESRMELLELQLLLLQDASAVDFARNQTLPVATLDYTYNISATGPSRDESLDMLYSSDFADHRLGLQVVIPLGNQAAKSRLRQAIYQRRQRLATRADRAELIKLEVLNTTDQVEANWQRILAARQNAILNGRLYEAEQRQFEQGQRTSTEVLDAQTRFADAQSSEIRALAEYQIALVDLAYATGTLLGATKVSWEPIVPASDVE
jgi:outer membrane protein